MVIINKGIWDCNTKLQFQVDRGAGTRVTENSTKNGRVIEIPVVSIDSAVQEEKVTFIKMDLEGSELKELYGAENTILTNHLRLAISLYHKPEDILTIPNQILSLSDEYRLYIRHYRLAENETVLYAI